MGRAARFRRIYQRNAWNGTETPAGPGSTQGATRHLQEVLPMILQELCARSVLDAGCSEASWMPELPGYVGMDIVPEAVARAQELHPDRHFVVGDFVSDPLPMVDAVICRDALQHLSLADGLTALRNFRTAGARYLLANSHRGGHNRDVPSGEWYEIDLEAPPFSLGAPIVETPDGWWEDRERYPGKVFGAYRI